jgi:hypothetical protein
MDSEWRDRIYLARYEILKLRFVIWNIVQHNTARQIRSRRDETGRISAVGLNDWEVHKSQVNLQISRKVWPLLWCLCSVFRRWSAQLFGRLCSHQKIIFIPPVRLDMKCFNPVRISHPTEPRPAGSLQILPLSEPVLTNIRNMWSTRTPYVDHSQLRLTTSHSNA